VFVETRFPDDTRIPNAPPTSLSRADSRAQRIANLDPSGCKQRGRKRQAAAAGEASPSGSFSSANAAISIARGDLPAQDDQRQRRLAVLLIDECECGPGVDYVPADASVSWHENEARRLLSGSDLTVA
jgi:hypothetical protein